MKLTGGAWSANAVGGMTFSPTVFFEFGSLQCHKDVAVSLRQPLRYFVCIRHAFLGRHFSHCVLAGQAPAMLGRPEFG